MTIEEELIKSAINVGKNIAEDIARPTSKSIGNNIGLLVDGVVGWLGYWGETQKIKREIFLNDYKRRIEQKIIIIPNENLIEPSIRIIGPTIEASKFFIEDESCREMFSQLIASACNSTICDSVHPAFPDMIKHLSPADGNFLLHYKSCSTFPCVELYKISSDEQITPCLHLLFDFKEIAPLFSPEEELHLAENIDNLTRFGLVRLNQQVIELNYDYNKFKEHWLYKTFLLTTEKDGTVYMRRYRAELTNFGKNFVKCCL